MVTVQFFVYFRVLLTSLFACSPHPVREYRKGTEGKKLLQDRTDMHFPLLTLKWITAEITSKYLRKEWALMWWAIVPSGTYHLAFRGYFCHFVTQPVQLAYLSGTFRVWNRFIWKSPGQIYIIIPHLDTILSTPVALQKITIKTCNISTTCASFLRSFNNLSARRLTLQLHRTWSLILNGHLYSPKSLLS